MMRSAAGAASRRVTARGGRRVRGRQRLAQRRGAALPEQPQHLLGGDGPLLAVHRAEVTRAVAETRWT